MHYQGCLTIFPGLKVVMIGHPLKGAHRGGLSVRAFLYHFHGVGELEFSELPPDALPQMQELTAAANWRSQGAERRAGTGRRHGSQLRAAAANTVVRQSMALPEEMTARRAAVAIWADGFTDVLQARGWGSTLQELALAHPVEVPDLTAVLHDLLASQSDRTLSFAAYDHLRRRSFPDTTVTGAGRVIQYLRRSRTTA